MKRGNKFVQRQHVREKPGSVNSYEEYVARGKQRAGEPLEDIRANPDTLAEGEQLWGSPGLTRIKEIMGEAIQHLQGRQRAVYELTMRDGKSLAEVAEIFGISKGAVQDYRERAIKFITAYCRRVAHVTAEDLARD